jgi:cell division septation protein DedD
VVPPPSPPAETPLEPAEADLSGRAAVQLASLRSREEAAQEWERLRRGQEDLLGELSPVIQRADLGAERGIYYRLRAGPLADGPAAIALCGSLRERGVDCLPIDSGP